MDNLAFGMGGALLQSVNRDTQKFAFKCSAIKRSGKWHPVSKNPKTDMTKASKAGRFMVSQASGQFVTIPYEYDERVYPQPQPGDVLETVFENGDIKKKYSLTEIRKRAASYDEF